MMRLLIVASTSKGMRAQSAVMKSWLSTARIATDRVIAPGVAHDADCSDRKQHRKTWAVLRLKVGGDQFFEHDLIGVAKNAEALGRDVAQDADGQPGAGEGCRQTICSGRPSTSPTWRTSSLNNSRSGSTSSNPSCSGNPPTLWCNLMLAAVPA